MITSSSSRGIKPRKKPQKQLNSDTIVKYKVTGAQQVPTLENRTDDHNWKIIEECLKINKVL